ncbi:MAG: hypothetical protein IPI24_14185 [Ignavibacteria bacterium]|nr:hypothetical protein [Ignavibacteria bacterium]
MATKYVVQTTVSDHVTVDDQSLVEGERTAFSRFGFISTQYVDQSTTALAATTLAGAANRIELYPYIPQVSHSIDRISCYVTTGVAAAQVKLVIYDSGTDGWPDALLYESAALAAATTNAIAEATMSQAFVAGTYLLAGAVRHSSKHLRYVQLLSGLHHHSAQRQQGRHTTRCYVERGHSQRLLRTRGLSSLLTAWQAGLQHPSLRLTT